MTANVKQAARRLARLMLEKGYIPEALHEYTDTDGSQLYWRIRLKHPDTGDKWIRPMKQEGSGFTLGEPTFEGGKPLYRLHQLVQRPDEPLYLVEGEKCADALEKLGLLATTSGGADSVEQADWPPIAGHEVVIWPDNDDAGQHYADKVTMKLEEMGCAVRRIDVGALALPSKGDCVDWLKANSAATATDISTLPTIALQGALESHKTSSSISAPQPDGENASEGFWGSRESDEARIKRLAGLNPIKYDQVRRDEARAVGVRPETLDKEVKKARGGDVDKAPFEDVEPWPQSVSPAHLLSDIAATIQRFIICQPETAHATALWVAMTWFIDVVQVAPLAVITAPEKRCGKSQLLSLMGRMARRPLSSSNITPAALFRSIDAWAPTLLIDEADAFMKDNEELRGLLNCGHTRESAYTVRVVGDDHTPTRFNVWGAKALAGIGHLADTLMDRSITLELRRRLPHEQVERLRHAETGLFDTLRAKLSRFAEDYSGAVASCRPSLPDRLNDRAQDNWEPLLAIAEVAGGEWLELARSAALKLYAEDSISQSIGVELLADIQDVFESKGDKNRISLTDLLAALLDDVEKPWATHHRGKPLTIRQLSRQLGNYGIKSKTLRFAYETAKGFERFQFNDAFERYLSAPLGFQSQSNNSCKANTDAAFAVTENVTEDLRYRTFGNMDGNVTELSVTGIASVTRKPASMLDCYRVTDVTEGNGGHEMVHSAPASSRLRI